jgi:flagellin
MILQGDRELPDKKQGSAQIYRGAKMKVNQNVSAVISNAQLHRTEDKLTASIERLSSGYKINKAKDNPAGIAISNKMRAQIEALDQSSQNASDGTSVLQTADGALNETHAILQRMRELAVQAATDSMTTSDREACQQEIESLQDEVDRIATDTEFNGKSLLDGTQDYRVYPSAKVITITLPAASGASATSEVLPEGADTTTYATGTTVSDPQQIMLGNCIRNFQTSDNVSAENYKFKLSSLPTQTEAKITVPQNTSGTISINGSQVDIDASDSADDIYRKLQEAGEYGNVKVTQEAGDVYKLTTFDYGDSASLTCTKDGVDIINPGTLKQGEDVQITLVKDTDSKGKDATGNDIPYGEGFSDTATVLTDGKKVTIRDLNGFEMIFEVDPEGAGSSSDLLKEVVKNGKNAGKELTVDLEMTNIGSMTLQIGTHENQVVDVRIPAVTCESLYISDLNLAREGGASKAIAALDDAIAQVSEVRSRIGAYQNRLDYASSSLDATEENMESAISRIMDTDMAEEMSTYSNMNVLDQAAISVLTQANDMPQQILQLLN